MGDDEDIQSGIGCVRHGRIFNFWGTGMEKSSCKVVITFFSIDKNTYFKGTNLTLYVGLIKKIDPMLCLPPIAVI